MQKLLPRRARTAAVLFSLALVGGLSYSELRVFAQTGKFAPIAQLSGTGSFTLTNALVQPAFAAPLGRPQYQIDANIDYDLLTLQSSARVQIPASGADPLRDAVFFLYANAGGVGGDDERRKNLVVDQVTLGNTPVPFRLDGAVLRVNLPAPQSAPFTLKIDYHGVVPRGAKDEGGMSDLMGGALGGDISSLLGMAPRAGAEKEKPKNTDYGLYTYGNGILSLGSFWYPALAVREGGKWADSPPEGLGDVAYAEKSDFTVNLKAPNNVTVVAPGAISRRQANGGGSIVQISAPDAREFALLMSEDYASKSRVFVVGGRNVTVYATLLKKNAAKLDKSLDIAGTALQIYSKRFGAYPFDEFKVVEAPMKGGAGGMEYSRVVGIASMVYGDLGAQLGGLTTSLNLPGADKLLESLGDDTLGGGGDGGKAAGADAGGDGGEGNPMTDMLGDVLGTQKEIFESLLETTIAHEVAHQWWAIGVGSDSQRHPFVDESLTNWCSMLYYEDRYGKDTADKMKELNLNTSFTMGIQMGGGDKRADLPTSAYTNNLQYGAVIYGKGAIYYDKLRELVGDAAFFAALRDYYARWNDRIAGPDTLLLTMQAHSPAKKAQIAALYKRWIEEAHGQEDIASAGGLDIQNLLGGILGGNLGGFDGGE